MNAVRWLPRGSGRGRLRSATRQAAMAVLLVLGAVSMAGAAIDNSGEVHTTPMRLGYVDGEVLFWRPGSGDWEVAQVNVPLAAGDALATREGKLELQFGRQSFIRAADGTQLRLESNEPDFLQLQVSAGYVTIDTRELGHSQVELDTPNAAIAIRRDGYYRVDVGNESTHVTVRRGGEATVTPAGGTPAVVATGDAIDIDGTTSASVTAVAAPAFDEWDRWNYDRGEHFEAAPRSYAVSADVYGTEDLEQYGNWRYVGTYGRVWAPNSVPAGWAPYTDGRWIWDPLYGWSWVDYSPWGWAPFHYGRWVYPGYWAWAPGPVVAAPIYSPALVGFFGGPGFGVGFSVGLPFVSWVALGWGEPLIPWWGGVGFIGVPCWHGWGGPHVVNNVVINNNTVINANNVNIYRNAQSPNGLVGVPKSQFDTRSLDRVRLTQAAMTDAKPIHGELPLAAKGTAAGAATKMPMPNFNAQRQVTDAHQNGAGSPSNFSRQGATVPSAAQRAGVPPISNGAKSSGNAALDSLHRTGPEALTARSPSAGTSTALDSLHRGAPAVPGSAANNRTADLTRSAQPPQAPSGNKLGSNAGAFGNLRTVPPPLPNTARGAANDALRRVAPPSVAGAPAGNSRTADFGRSSNHPPVPAAGGKSGVGVGTFNNLRSAPPQVPSGPRGAANDALRSTNPPMVRGGAPSSPPSANFSRSQAPQMPAAKSVPMEGTFSRLHTQPPALPQMQRSNPAGSAPSRFASISRQQEQRSYGTRPLMPNMGAFRAPSSRPAAPAPQASAPSFSRSVGGSVGGGGHSGGFSRGGGAAPSIGHSMGHMMGGGKLGR
jgi:hypothetical protein